MSGLAIAPDGTWLATTSYDNTVRIWDLHAGRLGNSVTGHTSLVTALAVAPDSAWLATTSYDNTVRVWDPDTAQPRRILTGHTGPVMALAAASDGSWLASVGNDGTARIWDTRTARCVMAIRTGHALRHVVTDGTRVVVAGDRGPYFLTIAGE